MCLLLPLALSGCGSWRASRMQRHADRGDDAWVVSQVVNCDDASHACARQHLIKGQACLRMAERKRRSAKYFTCAANGLAKGIALETSWENKTERIKMHEALCRALDGMIRKKTKKNDAGIRNQLLEVAQNLYQLAPGSAPAQYFIVLAWFRQLEPRIPGIDAANRLPVCTRLKRTTNRILSIMETAKRKPPPEWDRFEPSYQRLAFELGMAMRNAGCR